MTDKKDLTPLQEERLLNAEAHKLSVAKKMHILTAKKILTKDLQGKKIQKSLEDIEVYMRSCDDISNKDVSEAVLELLSIISSMNDTLNIYSEEY